MQSVVERAETKALRPKTVSSEIVASQQDGQASQARKPEAKQQRGHVVEDGGHSDTFNATLPPTSRQPFGWCM